MEYEHLITKRSDHVTIVTINHPPVNAWNLAIMEEFENLVGALEEDRETRVVILTGAGEKCFSAGFDISDAANAEKISPKGRALLVDSFLEDTGTLERDYFSGFQGDVPAGPGIPPFSRIPFFYAEFAKPADEDILSVLQVLLGDLEERFNRLSGAGPGQTGLVADTVDELGLRECHGFLLGIGRKLLHTAEHVQSFFKENRLGLVMKGAARSSLFQAVLLLDRHYGLRRLIFSLS